MTLRERVEQAAALLRQGFSRRALFILERALQAPDEAKATEMSSGLELAFDPRTKAIEPTVPEFSISDSFVNIKNDGWIIPPDVVEEMTAYFRDLFNEHKGDHESQNVIHVAIHTRLHQLVDSGKIRHES